MPQWTGATMDLGGRWWLHRGSLDGAPPAFYLSSKRGELGELIAVFPTRDQLEACLVERAVPEAHTIVSGIALLNFEWLKDGSAAEAVSNDGA